jgi:hypothetical protein
MTRLAADFHLHIYKVYPLESLLSSLFANLNRVARTRHPEPVLKAAFLAERRRYQMFQDWQRGHFRIRGYSVTPLSPHALEVKTDKGDRLLLFAGRQVATAESLEILSLVSDRDVPDALPFADAAERVCESGGIPVLPWAPGKWEGARKKLIRKGIETLAGRGLMLCDSSIRPSFFPDPVLFHVARRLGVPILAGTDTYPVAGEERLAGSYATLLEGDFDPANAAADIPRLLRERRFTACRRAGWRSHLPTAARRWLIHMFGSHNSNT